MKWVFRGIAALIFLLTSVYLVADLRLQPLNDQARERAPGDFIEISDGRLHYRLEGPQDGPLIVLVHGFSTPNFIYEQNVEALNAAGFRTLRFDHFGRGWSDRPATRYDIDFYDRAVVELLDGLEIDQTFGLVGLSMGGPIVAEFAARHPERVERLVLLVPAGLDTAGADGAAGTLLRTPFIGDWVWRMIGKDFLLSDRQYDESERAPENKLQGDVTEQFEYRGYLQALLSTFRHFPMTGREDTFRRLSQTGIPSFAIYGDQDQTVLVSSARKLHALVPEAEICVLEGGEHGLNYQMHAEVNPMLVGWFLQMPASVRSRNREQSGIVIRQSGARCRRPVIGEDGE